MFAVAKKRLRAASLLLLLVSLSGCVPGGQGQSEEEKEPHFLTGKSRVNAMDYQGAIESFEKALEVNPNSAAAHLELGVLFEQRESDPAAAIYHFERYLRLRPSAPNDEMVRQQILACKQELARTVSLGPVTQTLQSAFEKMNAENKRLTDENKRLDDENKALRDELAKLHAQPPPRPAVPVNPIVGGSVPAPAPRSNSANTQALEAASNSSNTSSRPVSAPRKYTIQPGDTPAAIAKRNGVKLDTFMAANPGLDARRLRPGQAVNIP